MRTALSKRTREAEATRRLPPGSGLLMSGLLMSGLLVLGWLGGCQHSSDAPARIEPSSATSLQNEPTTSPAPSTPATPAAHSPTNAAWCRTAWGPLDLAGARPQLAPVSNHYEGFGNIEGPVWLGDALYYSNIASGPNPPDSVIFRWAPGSAPELWLEQAGTNGLATDARGTLYAAHHTSGAILRAELDRPSEMKPVAKGYAGVRFNSPNDLVLAQDGTIYFTDPVWQAPTPHPQPETRVYRVGAEVQPLSAFAEVKNPNGITLTPDETRLFVGGENGLFVFELAHAQQRATRIQSEHLGEGLGIDGLGRDCAGNIYVTVHAEKLIVVLDKDDVELGTIAVPAAGGVTNVAFGGSDRRTLFVTSLGVPPQIHTVKLNVPGYPY